MSVNKCGMVVFSPCGGSQNVGAQIVSGMDLPVETHDLTLPGDGRSKREFAETDLAVFVFPVYGGRLPPNAASLFQNLEGRDTPCALVAVYGNRAYEGALLDLHDLALAKGFRPVAAVAAVAEHSMAPSIAAGRPDKSDAAALSGFGRKILELARAGHILEKAPGAMPEWKSPAGTYFYPITDEEKCVSCGVCAAKCPTGAIPADEPAKTDIEKCVVCAACAKYCPEQARVMGNEETHARFKPHLEAAAAQRREPELFY